MLDVPISLAVFVKTQQWLPTAELKCSFLRPARIGDVRRRGAGPPRRPQCRVRGGQALGRRRRVGRSRDRDDSRPEAI